MSRYQAPPVAFPVGLSFFRRAALLAAWALGGLAVLGMFWLSGQWPWMGLVLWMVAGGLAWRQETLQPSGVLIWDRVEGWAWKQGGARHPLPAPVVVWRGTDRLLLRWPSPSVVRWTWLERSAAPAQWAAMTRAAWHP